MAVWEQYLIYGRNRIMITDSFDNATEEILKVWTKEGPNLKAIAVQTGVTNGTLTQITSGLSAGAKVIIDVQSSMPDLEDGAQQNSNPFMPKPRNRNQDKDKKK